MLFAAWRRSGNAQADGAWPRIKQFAGSVAATPVETSRTILAATPPAYIARTTGGAVAWLHRSRPCTAAPSGPEVRVAEDSIEATAGQLPQYPLYYRCSPDESLLVLCSQLTPLIQLFPPDEIDASRVCELAVWQWGLDAGASMFRGLRRVEPCENIAAGANVVRAVRRMPQAGTAYLRASPQDVAAELRARIDAAVARAIGDASRVAVFVGGGLDSSGVLAMAVAQARGANRRHLEAIAAVWASPGGDDGPHLETLERELGMVAVRLSARDVAPRVAQSFVLDSQPQTAPVGCFDMALWSAALDRGAQVALGGHAGDDVLGGMVSFAPLARGGHPLRAVQRALALQLPRELSPLRRIGHWVALPLLRPYLPRPLRLALGRRYRRPWMRPRLLRALDACVEAAPRNAPQSPDEWLEHYCTKPAWSELAVSWGQFASVAPLHVVDVFRDPDLVGFIVQIDPIALFDGNMFRGLYRRAMKGVIPETIRLRQDKAQGRHALGAAIAASDAHEMLAELSTLRALAADDLVDPVPFAARFREWLGSMTPSDGRKAAARDESWYEVWHLLSLECFMRSVRGASG